MIRLAVDDSKAEVKTDTTLLHREVTTRSGPYPPNEDVDSIGQRVAQPNFVCMIDDVNGTVAGFDVQEVAQQVEVIWWLPRASEAEDNAAQLVPVFGAVCEEVMRRWPGSGPWPIGGNYPGVGDTKEARRRSSHEIVGFWVDYFNSTPAGVIAERKLNPYNDSQFRPVSTIKQMADFAKWVALQ